MSWFSRQIAKQRDNLLPYFVFLRISPLLPSWFINLASPMCAPPPPLQVADSLQRMFKILTLEFPVQIVDCRLVSAPLHINIYNELKDSRVGGMVHCSGCGENAPLEAGHIRLAFGAVLQLPCCPVMGPLDPTPSKIHNHVLLGIYCPESCT